MGFSYRGHLMIGKTVSHYRILEKLGGGGMGVVYKAEDVKLKRPVALKFLPADLTRDEAAKKRFVLEAQAASALDHPNICNIHEIDETEDGQLFICMVCYDGGTVKKKIEGGPLKLEEAIHIAAQVAEGLARAHEVGMIHRDIKPANIMVTERGEVKILDFGLAKLSGQTRLTRSGMVAGTVAYMSPEQARGENVDHRTDIWSLGVLLYEMVTGELPFKGEYQPAVVYSILHESPKPISTLRPDVPEGLERVIDRAMSKDPGERYHQVGDMLADLRAVEIGQETLVAKQKLVGMKAERKSIAVLPLKSLSDSKEDVYFSDGLTEDILTQLSKISDLRVISRQSVMQYKDSKKSLREIGRELNVSVILEGSVRRAGNRVRIVGQLIDARTDEHVWAETYDREMKDIFAIQSDVGHQIARALKVRLSPVEKERMGKKPTENLTAYDYYLKGRDYYYRYRKQDNENAIELFKQALDLDPGYALCYAGLADAYNQRVHRFGSDRALLESAIEAGEKALALDPNCAEAHKALGLAYNIKGLERKGISMYLKAVELNPSYFPAVVNVGGANVDMGELVDSLEWYKKAVALAPTFALSYCNVGGVYARLSKYAEAELWLNKALRLQPDLVEAYFYFTFIYLTQHRYEEALALGRKVLSIAGDDPRALCMAADVELISGKLEEAEAHYKAALEVSAAAMSPITSMSAATRSAYIHWKAGRRQQAIEAFGKSMARLQARIDQGEGSREIPHEISAIHAIQDSKEEACRWLRKAIDSGLREYNMTLIDPLFENLHDDEEFGRMMSEVKGMVDEMRRRVDKE
jgi:serine/threonine protein kinase/tetratricopeptide (TPR) repeat protein